MKARALPDKKQLVAVNHALTELVAVASDLTSPHALDFLVRSARTFRKWERQNERNARDRARRAQRRKGVQR